MIDGQCRRELLPQRQIRLLEGHSEQREILPAGHFVINACNVPSGYWVMRPSAAALLCREIEETLELHFVNILSRTMYYLRRRQDIPFCDDKVEMEFEDRHESYTNYRHNLLKIPAESDAEDEPKRKKPLGVGGGDLVVPLDVLQEIFRSLDTVDRQRCRRTCSLWDALLTSAELCLDVHVKRELPSSPYQVQWTLNYAMYACIFKHITPATRTLSIRDMDEYRRYSFDGERIEEPLTCIQKVLDAAGLRLGRLIIAQCSLEFPMSEPYGRWQFSALLGTNAARLSQLVSCCDRVIWTTYTLKLVDKKRVPLINIHIPRTVFAAGRVSEAHIADLFEQHLRWEGPALDVQDIAHFVANRTDSEPKAKTVLQVLEDYQSCDPRPSAHYREYQWSVDNVAIVDVSQMNRFCLQALSHYMQNWCSAAAE
ncbi:uncharacterized protein LOC129599599 isoform X2 [Paramacrobiotus metropolitanus]|uniref:uncharacterized protein LOC129599599 isoform X2 n=1 Tax=Paramacrobiotus metropolitanus TaxID=2943436 RepID=UPI0024464C86|nr:uncharacterized protein LOC129599599 isoform X2 [Paramacrobiotus metropolitanus]